MSNIKQINIPDLGDVEEVEVIEVCVEVGQTVGTEDSIMILETDKAAMEIPASIDGEIKNILINVGDMVCVKKAFYEVYQALRPGGTYLMCENFISGLSNINESRRAIGLEDITTRWHNTYIDDNQFYEWAQELYHHYEVNHFLSTYFFVSRVVNGWQAKQNDEDPKYDSDINKMAAKLPSYGQYSPMRLIILHK